MQRFLLACFALLPCQGSVSLLQDEAALRRAIEEGGPQVRLQLSRQLGARPESFSWLVSWLSMPGPLSRAAEEALQDLYRNFRGGKVEDSVGASDLEEAPADSFRRVFGRIPQEGMAFLDLVDRLHRAEILQRPLLLDPQIDWDSWRIAPSAPGEELEDFAAPLFERVLELGTQTPWRTPQLRSYSSFLWLSRETQRETESEIFLRLCRALRDPQTQVRRLAALNLGRLGFGPAESFFVREVLAAGAFWKEYFWGLTTGQGISPLLREPSTLEAIRSKLEGFTQAKEALDKCLRQVGAPSSIGAEIFSRIEKFDEDFLRKAKASGDCRALLSIAESLRFAARLAELPKKFFAKSEWEDVLLAAGERFPQEHEARQRVLAALRDPKSVCLQFLSLAAGTGADSNARTELAELALCHDCPEPSRVAALDALEYSIASIDPSLRSQELAELQSKLSPLRSASEKLAAQFDHWTKRSLKPPFEGENFLADFGF